MSKVVDTSTIGGRIKKSRIEKGMSQMKLAELLNMKQNTLSKYETGMRTPDIGLLNELAAILDADPIYLGWGNGAENTFLWMLTNEASKIVTPIMQKAVMENIQSFAALDKKLRMGMI